jgi:hypothetical protein
VGSTIGVVRVFDYTGNEKKAFTKDLSGQEVTCIDIHREDKYIAVGTKKGTIVIGELNKNSSIKTFNASHGLSILAVKFLRSQKLSLIWSDIGGDVAISEVSKTLMGYSVNTTVLAHEAYGFSLNPLFPNELYSDKLGDQSLIAIAGLDAVYIYTLNSHPVCLWRFKHKEATKHTLPYIDWGYGALPNNVENEDLILAIGWDKVIQLVVIRAINAKDGIQFAGYTVSDMEIIGLYWLSESTLFVANSLSEVMIVHTGNFALGKVKENPPKGLYSQEEKLSVLEKAYKIIDSLYPQTLKLGADVLRNSYHQTLAVKGHCAVALTIQVPVIAELYTWQEFLGEQRSKSEWLNVLRVSMELYLGHLRGFAKVPDQSNLRKEMVKAYLKNFLCESLLEGLDNDEVSIPKEDIRIKIAITIEFCTIINAFELLFNTLFGTFCENRLDELFFQEIEGFILNGRFAHINIPKNVFTNLLNFYLQSGRVQVLERVLLSLELEDQDLERVADICTTHKLYSALIYVKTLKNLEDQFTEPLIYMSTGMRIRARQNDNTKLEQIFSNPKLVETSAIYLGCKILWYIDLCFKGVKYPKNDKIPIGIWPSIIYRIINWIFLEQNNTANIKELMKQDYAVVFQVFRELFENEMTRRFLIDPGDYKAKTGYGFEYKVVLEKLKVNVKDLAGSLLGIEAEFSKFMGRVAATKDIKIDPEFCIEVLKTLANSVDENFTKERSEALILSVLRNQIIRFSREDKNVLIDYFSKIEFEEIVIYIWETKGEYIKCFDGFLDAKNQKTSQKIFDWLNRISDVLAESKEIYMQLKQSIYNRLERLLVLDMNKTEDIVDTWFERQHEEIIEKLKPQPILQLGYVQKVLKNKEEVIEKVFRDFSMNENGSEEYKRYYNLIILNVELLCTYKPGDIMEHIKKKWYPTEACLEICKKKNHEEAIAFLLKRSGVLDKSLEAYLKILTRCYESMLESDKEETTYKQAQDFKKFFELALKVCKKHAKVTGNRETEESLWFILLDKLYDIWMNVHKKSEDKQSADTKSFGHISSAINNSIKTLFDEMSNSVPLPAILAQVTKKHEGLEIASFKDMFTSMILTYFYQEKILETARKIISSGVVKEFKQLSKVKGRGVYLKHTYCSKCGELINPSSNMEALTFACRHMYHKQCLVNIDECYVCIYNDKSKF